MRCVNIDALTIRNSQELLRRNQDFKGFFEAESSRLADIRPEMSRHVLAGGSCRRLVRGETQFSAHFGRI